MHNITDPGKEKSKDSALPKPIFGENLLGKSFYTLIRLFFLRPIGRYGTYLPVHRYSVPNG